MKPVRVDTLLQRNGLDLPLGQSWFLNEALQGAELHALRGMGELLHRFDHAYVEVNVKQLYQGCPFVSQIDDYLRGFGLIGKETKMTVWGWGDKYYQRVK